MLLIICLAMAVTIIVCLVATNRVGKSVVTQRVSISSTAEATTPFAASAVASQTETPGIAGEIDSSNYYNSQYGFTIYFPKSWGKIDAVEEQGSGVEKVIDFSIATSDPLFKPAGKTSIFKLYISTKEQWDTNKAGTILDETANNIFSYITWEKSPSDLQTITEKEIAQVLGGFQLTN